MVTSDVFRVLSFFGNFSKSASCHPLGPTSLGCNIGRQRAQWSLSQDDGAQDVPPALRKLLDAFRERKVEEVHQAIARDTRHRTGDGPAVTAEQERLLLDAPESVLREGMDRALQTAYADTGAPVSAPAAGPAAELPVTSRTAVLWPRVSVSKVRVHGPCMPS